VTSTEAERLGAIRRAVDGGITYFDTAPTYGGGESERLLGRALAPQRDRVAIATKVGPRDDPRVSLEASLRRLGTEYVDLVQLHEALDGWEDRLAHLAALHAEGKAGAVGLCNATHLQLARALDIAPLATFQAAYNLFDRDVEQRELPRCRAAGVAFLAYRPLAAGLLTGKYDTAPQFPPADHRRGIYWFQGAEFARRRGAIARLRPIAAAAGLPLPALALAWVLARPGVGVVLAGARDAAQVEANLAAATHPIDADTVARIDSVVAETFTPPLAGGAARREAAGWGERERFIVERLDGERTPEQIAAEWTDRGEQPMIAAQVKVFADTLEDRGWVTRPGARGAVPS
jgi:aryl-alcohol dehydrogenase-like predicted oxidoreductase